MRSLLLLALATLIVGCGIDRGGAPDMSAPPSNMVTSTDSLAIGPIDDISAEALTISGVTINVTNAQFAVDGETSMLDMLHVGQYAVVRGDTSPSSGLIARSVDVDTQVIGPATEFDADTNALTILGQQVIVSSDTSVDEALTDVVFDDPAALGPLRVSGIADGFGGIFATYIAPEPVAPSRLTGFAAMVDAVNLNFLIGRQSISYASAMLIQLPSAAPLQNARVTLTGNKEPTVFTVDTIIDAALIPTDLQVGAPVQLTAVVTSTLTGSDFTAAFVDARLNTNATFDGGDDSNLVLGTIVTLQGLWTDNKRIDITNVRVERPSSVEPTK